MSEDYNPTRRRFILLTGGLSLPVLAGCASDDNNAGTSDNEESNTTDNSDSANTGGTSEEIVFDRRSHQRESATFQATRGDEIVVDVTNIEGFRTHVVVRSADITDGIGVLLSEGVEDKNTFRIQIEEDATYTIEMTPHDETQSTVGEIKAVLIPGEGPGEVSTDEEEEPKEEPKEAVRDWIMEHEQEIGEAMQTFESGNSRYEAEEYASAEELYGSAEEQFGSIGDDMVQKAWQWDRESEYHHAYASGSFCFFEMRDTAKIRRLAATNINQHNNEDAATERWEESVKLLEDAEECRERVKKEFSLDLLAPNS